MARSKKAAALIQPLTQSPRASRISSDSIRTYSSDRVRVQLVCPEGSGRTRQSFKEECDINNIMARFSRTGVLDFVNRLEPRYGDVTGLDYQQAMDVVATARSMFEDLPSALRARFENDPAQLLDFMADPANRDEAVKLGLSPRPESDARGDVATPLAAPPSKGASAASEPASDPKPSGGLDSEGK